MKKILLLLTSAALLISCATGKVTEENIEATAKTLDYGNMSSETLAGKAWDASADKNYPELFAYTKKCVELYGEQGKQMNAALTRFEPAETASKQWALNDAGTCLFIMAEAYVELKMYPEAVRSYRTLAKDYTYAQCWDPKGWYWHPADGAENKAKKYDYLD